MSKVLVDRELLERLRAHMDLRGEFDPTYPPDSRPTNSEAKFLLELSAILAAQPAEAEGVEVVAWRHFGDRTRLMCAMGKDRTPPGGVADEFTVPLMTVAQHLAALSAVTVERDRLRDAAGKAIAWLDAEQNGSGVGINRRLKLCRDAENSLRAAMAAKEA